MKRNVLWLAGAFMVVAVSIVAAWNSERLGSASAQPGSTTAVPGSAVPGVGTTIVQEIIIPTLAPGEPTPDFSLPPDAPRDVEGEPALQHTFSSPESAFTREDIVDYLSRRPHPYAVPQGTVPEIVEIYSLSAKDAAQIVMTAIYRPDDYPVVVAVLRGEFFVNGPVGYALTGKSSFMAFDAVTGNLLTVAVGQ